MLQSKPTDSSSKSTTKPVKTLTTSLPREESKTPEIETVAESKKQKKLTPTKTKKSSTPSKSKLSPLSSRALRIKQSLIEKKDVSAVILKPDGSAEEIKYNGSSKQANYILGGRPSIIGEYEELAVIVVRSLNQSQGELNKNILPVPFCNKQFNGPYLLYKVDKNGNPSDLSLEQFKKFQEKNKGLTESARKNYNPIEDQQIKPKSSFSSSSKLTLVYLRSEVDKKIRAEYEKKTGKKPKNADIEHEVNEALQKLVDELVSSSSPMNDPDYNPSDDVEKKYPDEQGDIIKQLKEVYNKETGGDLDNKQLLSALENTKTLLATETNPDFDDDSRDWRLQLNDALNYVRERGRLDGRILADKISETFYELNGVEPSLDELIDVFRRIKQGLADEAEEDILRYMHHPETTDLHDNGSAFYLAQKLGNDFNNADPADIVDYAFRIVKEDLVSRSKSLFLSTKGRNPSKQELKECVESLALKLAKQALDSVHDTQQQSKSLMMMDQTMMQKDDETVNDPDYDPNNAIDKKLAKDDQMEDEQFDSDYFNLRMLTTERTKSRLGNAESYDVYFCKFSKKREARNLEKAIATFKLRNKREPNAIEIEKIKQFISTKPATNLIEFKLAIVDDADNENEENEEEKSDVLITSKSGHATKKGILPPTTPSKVLVTPVKSKKAGKRYNVYFGDDTDKLDQKKNEQQALKWFKRFNHREPNDLELAGIKQFVAADKSELTAVEYEVPVDLKDLVGDMNMNNYDDDRKETEEDDKLLVQKLKFNESSVVKKANKATKYTLNFDNEDERENGDEQQAMKWFKRFNNRSPNNHEIEKIRQFIKADNNEDTVDID